MSTGNDPPPTGIVRRITDYLANAAARAALRRFDKEQEKLQSSFLQLAHASGKPRGLRWANCDWLDERVLLRDQDSGILTLCVGLNVRFEAIEGGEMEGIDAVSTVRDACAIFHFRDGRWGTAGRVLFNHSPELAAVRLEGSWVRVD